MLARRLLLLAAVLMLLTVLATSIAPRDLTGEEEPPPLRTSLPAGEVVVREVPATPGAASARVAVNRGDTLQLEVFGDLLDSVLLERLDQIDAIAPEAPARFNILIDQPAGSYPIRLVDADRRIGSIVISE
jgi:hypothetical protein